MKFPVKIDSDIIKHLTEPMIKIIDIVSNAIGVVYEPIRIERTAKANAKSKIYETMGELVSSELERRGLQFYIHQLGKKQLNIEQIINRSLNQQYTIDTLNDNIEKVDLSETEHYLNKDLDKDSPEESWIMDFFDLCQNSSNEDIQEIWAALLRLEIDRPGTVSRRLMHTIKILSQKEAVTFQNMSKCYVQIIMGSEDIYKKDSKEKPTYFFGTITVIGDVELYEGINENEKFGFNHTSVSLLEEIGLINRIQFYSTDNDAREILFGDESKIILINAELELCHFTSLGLELFDISKKSFDSNYKKDILNELAIQKMVKS